MPVDGFGMVTFAFLDVQQQKNFDYRSIDAFDLTPAMLSRFPQTLEARAITRVQLRQADVLALDTLPDSWTDYDLIYRLRCSNTYRNRTSLAPWTGYVRIWYRAGTCRL
jgi:hypothetical protein